MKAGVEYTSPPLFNADDLITESKVYSRAMLQEKEMMAENIYSSIMQELSARMMSCRSYKEIFTEMFKLEQAYFTLIPASIGND